MRIVGLDLAVTGTHKGVVMSDRGEYVSPVFAFRTQPEALEQMLARAGEGAEADESIVVVMESTGHRTGLYIGVECEEPNRARE